MNLRHTIADIVRKQHFKNAGWNLFSTLAYPLVMLVATPLFIHKLGTTQFGIWMLVNSISQTMNVLNMGLGDANIRYISSNHATGDQRQIGNITAATFAFSLIAVVVIVPGGILIAYLVSTYDLFNVTSESRALTVTCIQLGVVIFSLKFIEIIVLSILQGFGRYDHQSKFSFLSRTAIIVTNIAWVFYRADLVILLINSIVVQFVFVCIEILFIKRRHREVSFLPRIRKESARLIFQFSLWTWLQSAIAIVAANLDKFIVAYFSGVDVLSYYSLGYLVMTQLHAVFSASSSWVFPLISAKQSRGESVSSFYHSMQAIVASFGFTAVAAALLLQKPLVSLWLGGELAQQAFPFIRIYLFTNFFYTINIIPHHVLNGTGHVKHNTLSEFVMKSTSIGLMILFYYLFGDVGLIWGIVGSLVLTTPLKVGIARKYGLGQSNLAFDPGSVLPGILIITVFSLNNPALIALGVGLFLIAFYWIYLKPGNLAHLFNKLST